MRDGANTKKVSSASTAIAVRTRKASLRERSTVPNTSDNETFLPRPVGCKQQKG
jgi:hypothetical protein